MIADATDEDPRGEPDLAPAHERWLSSWALAEHGSRFLFVTGYPTTKRPFYTHPTPNTRAHPQLRPAVRRPGTRHRRPTPAPARRLPHRPDTIGQDPGAYASYLDTFAHGMPPHGGFGIGLERFTARLTGAENIRSVTLFPRDLHRLQP